MKTNQYFPFEVNMINTNEVSRLIETYGPKGFGVYIMILTELRHSPNNKCSMSTIKGMARRCKISQKMLDRVMADFNLFEVRQEADGQIIASPYLDRVMNAYHERLIKLSEAGKKRSNKSTRDAHGQFTSLAGALDKSRTDKNKPTTTVVGNQMAQRVDDAGDETCSETAGKHEAATVCDKSWEKHLDIAVNDEMWMELLAMNSGISRLFVKHRESVIEGFRRHVNLQGKGYTLHSPQDVKAYFANFLRQGTPTQKRIAEELLQREEEEQQTEPNRYETIDPQTGERSYFGNLIPPEASPRPNENAVWSHELHQWI